MSGFQYDTYRPDTGTIIDLMTRGDRARAEAARASGLARARAAEISGQNSAQLAGSIGAIALGVGNQISQYQQDKPRREMEQIQLTEAKDQQAVHKADQIISARLRELFRDPEHPPRPEAVMSLAGPERGMKIVQGLAALRADSQKNYASTQELLKDVLGGMDAVPEDLRAELYPSIRENLLHRGLITAADAPEAYDKAWFQTARNFGKEPAKREPFTLNPGDVRFDETGTQIASAPIEPKHSTAYQEWLDYKTSGGTETFDAYMTRDANRKRPVTTIHNPPQPTVIQGPDGPLLLDKAGNTTKPVLGPDGKPLAAAPTADMRSKAQGREFVAKSIGAIRDLSNKIITRVGPAQRADAIKRGAEAVFGNDPEFRTYQDARKALAGNLAVAQQGSRPSDADILAIWLPLVPDSYRDTAESAAMKWELIDTMSGTSTSKSTPPPPKPKGANPFR